MNNYIRFKKDTCLDLVNNEDPVCCSGGRGHRPQSTLRRGAHAIREYWW